MAEALEKVKKASALFEAAFDELEGASEALDSTIQKFLNIRKEYTDSFEEACINQLKNERSAMKKPLSLDESQALVQLSSTKRLLISRERTPETSKHSYGSIWRGLMVSSILKTEPPRTKKNVETIRLRLPQHLNVSYGDFMKEKLVYRGHNVVTRDPKTIIKPQKVVGVEGGNQLEFKYPDGIAVHPVTGNIYVVDHYNDRIQVLTPDLEFVSMYGTAGSGPGEFRQPYGIAISCDGTRLVVVDSLQHRVQLFDDSFNLIRVIGSQGSQECTFSLPYNVDFDEDGFFYVSEYSNCRIQKFTGDGEFVRSIGDQKSTHRVGSGDGVCVSQNGQIYSLAWSSSDLMVFDKDGEFIRSIKVKTTSANGYNSNKVTRGPKDGFVISYYGSREILFYDLEGSLLHTLSHPNPGGIAFGLDGRFYVADWSSMNVSVY